MALKIFRLIPKKVTENKVSVSTILIGILLIAMLFRFYNVKQFQFWYSDEEFNAMVVRKMVVEKRPVLISPSGTTGLTLGSYFQVVSVPLFYFSKFNTEIILGTMGFLGILTTYLIFLIGKLISNTKLGLVSSFLYATSFVMGLYDRRWWNLSIAPILTVIAIYSIIQIKMRKKYIWSIPLAACIGFAFHTGSNIVVIVFATLLVFVVLKISILRKEYILALATFLLFLLPLGIFELMHPGAVTHPIEVSFSKNTPSAGGYNLISGDILNKTNITFANMIFPKASNFAEIYVGSQFSGYKNLFGPVAIPLILLLIIFPIIKFTNLKKSEKQYLLILYCFLITFFIGLFLFSIFYKKSIWQHYFTIVLPVFFLITGFSIVKAVKNKIILFSILAIIFFINFYALINSTFRYPLYQKKQIVSDLSAQLLDSDFSLYQTGDDYFIGGGFPILFNFNNKYPKRSNAYDYYDWLFRAHSLYPIEPSNEDQDKIVIISKDFAEFDESNVLYRKKVGFMYSVILDNRDRWYGN